MAQTISNYDAILKEYYEPDRVAMMMLQSSPLMALVPKREIMGSSWELPIVYAGTGGRSATFSTALTNKGQTSSTKFQITTTQDYALASVDRKLMLTSEKDLGSFLPAAKTNIDAAILQLRRSLAITAYRSGTGSRGAIGSLSVGNTVVTLTNVTDAVNFMVGDVIQLTAVEGVAPLRAGSAAIIKVDRNAGKLTFSADLTTLITGTAVGDTIYDSGDFNSVFPGLSGWCPSSAPSATPFYGVDRTVDSMLVGVTFDGSNMLRYEGLIEAQSQASALGDGRPTHAFCHPVDFRQLILEMEAQVRRYRDADVSVPVRKGSNAVVGFTGVIVQGDNGTIQVFPDRFCPVSKCYLLQLEDWSMAHIGPELVSLVGRSSDSGMLVETTSDGYEVRITSYPALATCAPGHSAVLSNWGL